MASVRLSLPAFFLLALIALNVLIALVMPNPGTSVASCVLYLGAVALAFRRWPKALLLLSPLVFVHFSVLVSLVAVESGAFLRELGMYGKASSASAVYLVVVGLFLWVAALTFERLTRQIPTHDTGAALLGQRHPLLMRWLPLGFLAFALLLLLAKGASTGFPLIAGYDRFAYRRAAGDAITLNLLNLKIVIAVFLAIAARHSAGQASRWCFHAGFFCYLVVSALFGDKFFILIVATMIYVAGLSLDDIAALRRLAWRALPLVLVVAVAAAALTVYIYSGSGRLSLAVTAQKLFDRMASQSQLWFSAYEEGFRWLAFDTESVLLNLQSLVESPAAEFVFDKHLAAFHFIWKYATSHMYWSFVGNAGYVAPVMAFEAYMMELFGFGGALVAVVLAAAMVGAVAAWIYRCVLSGNPYQALLPAHVYVQCYYLITGGTLFTVFSLGTMKAYAAFFVLHLLVRLWTQRLGNTQHLLLTQPAAPAR